MLGDKTILGVFNNSSKLSFKNGTKMFVATGRLAFSPNIIPSFFAVVHFIYS